MYIYGAYQPPLDLKHVQNDVQSGTFVSGSGLASGGNV